MINVLSSTGLISEIVALAWADDVSFDEIKQKHGLSEKDVIHVMRAQLKPSSFKLWRKRVAGRKSKHRKLMQNRLRTEPSAQSQDPD